MGDFLLEEDFDDDSELAEDVALDVIELKEPGSQKTVMEYPSVLIEGITSVEEFKFFHERSFSEAGQILPLYCCIEGTPIKVGNLELSMESLLSIRMISCYSLYIQFSETKNVEIDLNDPLALVKFIKLM